MELIRQGVRMMASGARFILYNSNELLRLWCYLEWGSVLLLSPWICDDFLDRNEINQLLNLLGRPCDPVPPVFVYGPTATGKTSIVHEAIRVLRRPHAYVSYRSSHIPRLMFELLGHVRSASNNYSSARKCESLIDFAKHLPEACAQALSRKRALDKRLRSITKVRDRLFRFS